MDKKKIIDTLEMISQDMEADAKHFDGQPFTGKTVAEYFGNQGAAIAALANIVKSLVAAEQSFAADGFTDEQRATIRVIARDVAFSESPE